MRETWKGGSCGDDIVWFAPPQRTEPLCSTLHMCSTSPSMPFSLLGNMAAETSGQSRSATSIYAEVENYPWNSDDDFKNGLDAILGANPSPEQAAELTLRARCFYYARFVRPLKLYAHLLNYLQKFQHRYRL